MANVANPTTPKSQSVLERVEKGNCDTMRLLMHGPEGIGKSTWASGAAHPLFLAAEDGLGPALDHVDRFKVTAWIEVLDAVRELGSRDHSFETLVVDSVDWLETLVHRHVCDRDNKKSIEDYGYGKGYVIVAEELDRLLRTLDDLRKKCGMNIILLGHSHIKMFSPPDGDSFDRWELKGHRSFAARLKEWVDALLFAKYEVFVEKAKGATKGRGFGGSRKAERVNDYETVPFRI